MNITMNITILSAQIISRSFKQELREKPKSIFDQNVEYEVAERSETIEMRLSIKTDGSTFNMSDDEICEMVKNKLNQL